MHSRGVFSAVRQFVDGLRRRRPRPLDGWTAHAHAAANGGEERGEGERGWWAVWNSPRDGGHSRALGGLSARMPSSWWSVDLMSSESPACSDARWSSPQCNCACVRQQAMICLLLESGWADKRKEYIPRRKGSTFFYYVKCFSSTVPCDRV
jgi:hypothetical protein